MFKINSEKYIEVFKDWPNHDMILSNWKWEVKYYFFYTIPIVIYTKKLIK